MRQACHLFARFLALPVALAARAEEGGAGHYAPRSTASFADVLPDKRNGAVGRARLSQCPNKAMTRD